LNNRKPNHRRESMGTPVKIRAREEKCVGAGPCGDSRPMTKEEMLKYYTKEEIERMSTKITPPEKEKLIEVLAKVEGKTKAIYHASKVFQVSSPVIYSWLKEYGIQFDYDGRVIRTEKEFAKLDEEMQNIAKVMNDEPADNMPPVWKREPIIPKGDLVIGGDSFTHDEITMKDNPDTIHITGQETTEIHKRLGYAEHDIGNATLQIDFRKELVKIITPDNDEMTFEEAIAAAELILDILGHE
jgi:hypothetical protein